MKNVSKDKQAHYEGRKKQKVRNRRYIILSTQFSKVVSFYEISLMPDFSTSAQTG